MDWRNESLFCKLFKMPCPVPTYFDHYLDALRDTSYESLVHLHRHWLRLGLTAFVAGLKKRAKCPLMVLAGFPEGQEESLRQAGVEEFIHLRVDALETLERIAQKAGVLP
jgi:hypothetical protein